MRGVSVGDYHHSCWTSWRPPHGGPRTERTTPELDQTTGAGHEQRGLEHALYEQYPEAMSMNGGYNKIRAISPSNPNLSVYIGAANNYLARLGAG